MNKYAKMNVLTVFLSFSILLLAGCQSQIVKIKSPAGKVCATVFVNDDSRLTYKLRREKTTILEDSPMGINIDGKELGRDVRIGKPQHHTINETYPWRGVKSKAVNHYNSVIIPVIQKDALLTWQLETRAYDDGFAYRYIIPGNGKRKVISEKTAWHVLADCNIWYQTDTKKYEALHNKKALKEIEAGLHIGFPITIELPDASYAAVTEGALFNYSGMTLITNGTNLLQGVFEDDPNGFELDDQIRTPWRITMTGTDLESLVNCTIVPGVCPPPAKELFPDGIKTAWLKTGRAFWSWWSEDTVGPEAQKDYALKASQMGFEGILIDYKWEEWPEKWKTVADVVSYANSKGVGVWVWKHFKEVENQKQRRDFFSQAVKAGVAGVKIDFMDSESLSCIRFYENALKDAAEYKLMINFHGANKPTGESRTYPNEMTREGIRGLEHNKWSTLPAYHYAALPFTRFLAGHGDCTPCTLNPDFLKGTTFALQIATAIVFTSPQLIWADKPDLYINSPAKDFFRRIPPVWDETHVLAGSKIGELAAFARRNNDTWFVGVINGGEEKQYSLDFSFLGEGIYNAIFISDEIGNPAAMKIATATVKNNQKMLIEMNKGGGFAACLYK